MNIEHWKLAVEVEQALRLATEEADSMSSIAVDLHDLLSAADKLRHVIAPQIISCPGQDRDELRKIIRAMAFEFEHVAFHAQAAVEVLDQAAESIRE